MPAPHPGQEWKHGWIPVTPGAAKSKNHGKKPGAGSLLARVAAEAGAIHKRMQEQDAERDKAKAAPNVSTAKAETARQADAAIRKAAGRSQAKPSGDKPAPQPARKPGDGNSKSDDTQAGTPITGKSNKPLLPNKWGAESAQTGEVVYHEDGQIGQAVKRMGDDARLDVDGEPLANVLGKLATDAVAGRKTSQQVLDRVKRLRDRLPAGSAARRSLDTAIKDMDAPNTPTPAVPDVTPKPLKKLVADLHAVPTVRREPGMELDDLLDITKRFADGKTGGGRMLSEVRQLGNRRHESIEGKTEIDRVINQAVQGLEDLKRSNPKALYPPTSR